MYASSSDARWALTSLNGTWLAVRAVTTRSEERPETVSRSAATAAIVPPACASTVIASAEAAVRNRTRSPDGLP